MKVSEQFLAAKKHKGLSGFLVISRLGENENKPFIRLCLDVEIPFKGSTEMVFVETETEIKIENYSGGSYSYQPRIEPTKIAFQESCGHYYNHADTFLRAIKKDTDVKFRIVAFNGSIALSSHTEPMTNHKLYGILNDKDAYLLSAYTGFQDINSPVR
jgi:hypothetical protein